MEKTTFTAIDNIKKTLLNYDLIIASVHSDLALCEARIARYKNYTSKKYKYIYENTYYEQKRLLLYLNQLREGQKNCKNEIKSLLETYYSNETHREVWYMHFIEDKTCDEIADKTNYEPAYVRKLITRYRKDLIDLGF